MSDKPEYIEVTPDLRGDFSDYVHLDGVLVRADLVQLTPTQADRFVALVRDERYLVKELPCE